jgi:heat shock protein HslJ
MKLRMLFVTLLVTLLTVPVFAQGTSNSVTFNGVSFSFDSSVAANVVISQYPGDPADLGPGAAEPPYTQFGLFNQFPAPESILDSTGNVRVYNAADFTGHSEHEARLAALQSLLTDRPDLAQFMAATENASDITLPFIPVFPAGQTIRAQAQFLETDAVRGIRYITAYQEAIEPFLSDSFLYTFQGVSADGSRYVSVIFPLNTDLFPADIPSDFDTAVFQQEMATYLPESIATLSSAAPENFTPNLTTLDALVQSMSFAGASTPTNPTPAATEPVENTDPTMGGLAGINWTLVSYGSADAQTPVLPEAPITAAFSEQGVSGSAGCNTYNGSFQFANGTLTFGEIISTRIACDEPVMAQETAYLNALTTASTFQINNGQLQITYEGGVLTFRDATLISTALEGNWTLVSYGSADAPTTVLPEAPITATFAASQVSGNVGCNTYSGTVQVQSNTVTFGTIVSTLMACADQNLQAQETAYLNALTTASTFQIANGQLQIIYEGGVLTFAAA